VAGTGPPGQSLLENRDGLPFVKLLKIREDKGNGPGGYSIWEDYLKIYQTEIAQFLVPKLLLGGQDSSRIQWFSVREPGVLPQARGNLP
jgi:hypothetical protein